jgi:hypothetical protein
MNDNSQNQNLQNNQAQQDDQQAQPQVAPQVAPISPTGSLHKEAEPIIKREPLIKASEEEPALHPEVAEAGVETVSEKPKLNEEHIKAGLEHAKESTPVKTEPTDKIKFPLTAQKANQIIKNKKNIKDSILWLAISVLRQIRIVSKKKN